MSNIFTRLDYSFNSIGAERFFPEDRIPPGFIAEVSKNPIKKCIRSDYPIVITEDVEFSHCSFVQEKPHTEIFDVQSGTITFTQCNLINVKTPTGSVIVGGNLAQIVRVKTGWSEEEILADPSRREYISLLHDCDKCASATLEIRARLKDKSVKNEKNVFLHHLLKEKFAERRLAKDVTLDQDAIRKENVLFIETKRNPDISIKDLPEEDQNTKDFLARLNTKAIEISKERR